MVRPIGRGFSWRTLLWLLPLRFRWLRRPFLLGVGMPWLMRQLEARLRQPPVRPRPRRRWIWRQPERARAGPYDV